MSGLLIKDFKIFKNQMKFLYLCFVLAFLAILEWYVSYITSYLAFWLAAYVFGSFSYDEFDDGMNFLLALPGGRKGYVREKYVFSFLLLFGGWMLASLLKIGYSLARESWGAYAESLPLELAYLLFALLFVSVAIPLMLRFGVEKGRTAAFLGLAVTGFLVVWAVKRLDDRLLQTVEAYVEGKAYFLLTCLAALTAAVAAVSYVCSVWVMGRKEY